MRYISTRFQIALSYGLVLCIGAWCNAQPASQPVAISAKVTASNAGDSKLLSPEEAIARTKEMMPVPALDEIKDDAQRAKARENWSALAQVYIDYIPELPKTLLTTEGLQWYIDSANNMLPSPDGLARLDHAHREKWIEGLRLNMRKYASAIPDRAITIEQRRRRTENCLAFSRESARVLRDVVRKRGINPPEQQDETIELITQQADSAVDNIRIGTDSIFHGKLMAVFDRNPFDEKKAREYYETALPPGPLVYHAIRAEAHALIKAYRMTIVDYTPYGEPSAAERAKMIRAHIEEVQPSTTQATIFMKKRAATTQAVSTRPAR